MQQLCLGDNGEPRVTLVKIRRPVVRGGRAEPVVGSQSLAFSVQNGCDAFLKNIVPDLWCYIRAVCIIYVLCIYIVFVLY